MANRRRPDPARAARVAFMRALVTATVGAWLPELPDDDGFLSTEQACFIMVRALAEDMAHEANEEGRGVLSVVARRGVWEILREDHLAFGLLVLEHVGAVTIRGDVYTLPLARH